MMISGPLKLNSPGMPGAHNRANSVWMWSALDFDLAWRRAKWGRFWARLTLRAKRLPLLHERTTTHLGHHRTDLGLRVVATKAIIGSVGRRADFDHNFTPLHKHIAQRWISINRAHYLGRPLPPVELIEVNGRYFVSDGHHRVSVARWHGQAYLEAHVVRLAMDAETSAEDTMKAAQWTRRVRRGVGMVCLTLLWWLLLAPLQPVYAHGDGRVLQLATAAGDDLHLTVWSAPGILRTGEIHIVTGVNDGQAAPRADVLVQVQLLPLETGGAHMTALAYPIEDTSGATKTNNRPDAPTILHEAAFVVTEPGRYQVQIDVVDSMGAGGAVTFPIAVVTVPVWFKGLLYVQGMLALGVGLLLVRRGQQLWFRRPAHPQQARIGQFRAINAKNDAF